MTIAAERVEELLVDRVTEGLDPRRERELQNLLDRCPEVDPESYELAAAAIELACARAEEPLPEALRDRLVRRSGDLFPPGVG